MEQWMWWQTVDRRVHVYAGAEEIHEIFGNQLIYGDDEEDGRDGPCAWSPPRSGQSRTSTSHRDLPASPSSFRLADEPLLGAISADSGMRQALISNQTLAISKENTPRYKGIVW